MKCFGKDIIFNLHTGQPMALKMGHSICFQTRKPLFRFALHDLKKKVCELSLCRLSCYVEYWIPGYHSVLLELFSVTYVTDCCDMSTNCWDEIWAIILKFFEEFLHLWDNPWCFFLFSLVLFCLAGFFSPLLPKWTFYYLSSHQQNSLRGTFQCFQCYLGWKETCSNWFLVRIWKKRSFKNDHLHVRWLLSIQKLVL